MKYLLDTHVLVWWLADDARLETRHRALLNAEARAGTLLGISDLTLWEMALLAVHGRLRFSGSIADLLEDLGARPDLAVVPIDHRIALDAARLPEPFPRDPADRVIAATAWTRGLTLVTQDREMIRSGAVATA